MLIGKIEKKIRTLAELLVERSRPRGEMVNKKKYKIYNIVAL